MATDYTTNYHLDKYTANDKPNLRDQYNAAMDKIDGALLSANTNATEAKAATQSFAGDIAAKADQTDLDALTQTVNGKASQADLNTLGQTVTNQGLELVKMRRNIRNKRIVVIGDSQSYSATHHASRYWWQYLNDMYGCATYNFAIGGVGFATNSPTFLQQLQNAANSSSFTNDSITDVVIIGSTNDFQVSDATLKSAAITAFTYARTTFSKAEIHFGTMLKGTKPLGAIHTQSPAQIELLERAAKEEGISLIEAPWTWVQGISEVDYGDGLHVNATGQKIYAGYIASHLMGGSTLRYANNIEIDYNSSFAQYLSSDTSNKFHGNITGYTFNINGCMILKDAASNPLPSGNTTLVSLPDTFKTSIATFAEQISVPITIDCVLAANNTAFIHPRLYITSDAIAGQKLPYIKYSGTSGNLLDFRFGFNNIPFGI